MLPIEFIWLSNCKLHVARVVLHTLEYVQITRRVVPTYHPRIVLRWAMSNNWFPNYNDIWLHGQCEKFTSTICCFPVAAHILVGSTCAWNLIFISETHSCRRSHNNRFVLEPTFPHTHNQAERCQRKEKEGEILSQKLVHFIQTLPFNGLWRTFSSQSDIFIRRQTKTGPQMAYEWARRPPVVVQYVCSNIIVRNETAISLFESVGKMAESKGSLLAKSVQKHAGRAKEKVCVRKFHIRNFQ